MKTIAEYIDRDALLLRLKKVVTTDDCFGLGMRLAISHAVECIEEAPAADVAAVKHGEWLPDYETFVDDSERESEPIQTGWVCSLCGRQEFKKEPYCHCGAKMDGKDGDV